VFTGVVIAPEPSSPAGSGYFGCNQEVILRFGTQGPLVSGVCQGFQGIYCGFGGQLEVAVLPMRGKVNLPDIRKSGVLLQGVPYLRFWRISRRRCLIVFALLPENGSELMALTHRDYPIFGVQLNTLGKLLKVFCVFVSSE
jgi:anthranilate/para-aminobenzoate synthase component II